MGFLHRAAIVASLVLVVTVAGGSSRAREAEVEGTMMVWVERDYNSWDNALKSEFTINSKTIDVFTSDTRKPIDKYLTEGWNTITVRTTPEEPVDRANQLIFRIGPVRRAPGEDRLVMGPVLWEFRNGTDWEYKDGTYSHPLGPEVKEVTLSMRVYFAGLEREAGEPKAGDYVLISGPSYDHWNAPVTATVFVNETLLNSFIGRRRQIVISPLLKQGKNEIKLVTSRIKDSFRANDIEFRMGGPAEYSAAKREYLMTPVVQFKSLQGWVRDEKTGQLINRAKPGSETFERTIPFSLKETPKAGDK